MKNLSNQIANGINIQLPAEFQPKTPSLKGRKVHEKPGIWTTRFIEGNALQKVVNPEVSEENAILSVKRTIGTSKKAITLLGWAETLVRYEAPNKFILPVLVAFFNADLMNEEKEQILTVLGKLKRSESISTPEANSKEYYFLEFARILDEATIDEKEPAQDQTEAEQPVEDVEPEKAPRSSKGGKK
jgi:hypothetical protein